MKSAKKAQKCAVCGAPAQHGLLAEIDEKTYFFDKASCVLLLKKFHSVYGRSFCMLNGE